MAKPFSSFSGLEHGCVGLGHIQLCDLGTGAAAGVGDGKGDLVRVRFQVGVGKGGVAQAVTEGIAHRHMGRFVVAVADVQALAVLHVLLFAREIPGRRGVLVGQGQSLGQLAAGVHPAGEHIHDGTGTGPARSDRRAALPCSG